MTAVVIIILVALVIAVVTHVWPKYVSPELHEIVSDLTDTVDKLEEFIDNKGLQVADHIEEIALHQKHVDVKRADQARAQRIRDKLNELLQ